MSASSEDDTEVVVVLPADLHARPAGAVSRLAATFDAEVEMISDHRVAPADSVLMVMGLGARAGQEITVRARGRQAAEAVTALAAALSTIT